MKGLESQLQPCNKKFYQYTFIDKTTRENFLYWYDEHTQLKLLTL